MKKPAFKAGYLIAAAATAFAMLQPVVAHAQTNEFLLGDIKVLKEFAEQVKATEEQGKVLAATVTEEQPAVTEESAAVREPVIVEVVNGDTLSKIATSHNTTYKRLFDANEFIADPNIINPGEKIRVPFEDEVVAERPLPAPKPIAVAKPKAAAAPRRKTPSAPAPAIADGSVWDALARCESGGNWAINTGNGYYGGLQFNAGTWISNGGGQYASHAHLATREQQIDIAQRLHAARGFKPWPACSRKLGLL